MVILYMYEKQMQNLSIGFIFHQSAGFKIKEIVTSRMCDRDFIVHYNYRG